LPRLKTLPERKRTPNQVHSDRIYGELRDLIVSGRLAPGTRLVEAVVAQRLGASRTPVRAAFHRLQQEGYAIPADPDDHRVRLIVAPATAEDGADLYHILGELEGLAGYYAAGDGRERRERLVDEMKSINLELAGQSRAESPDVYRVFELDALLHRRCVEESAPPRLLALHDAIKPQVDRYARLYATAFVGKLDLSSAVAEHDAIIRAIEAGDGDGAQNAIRDNWRNGAKRIATVIAKWGESGAW
jgi:DNA-binding GntR family transcriptional regulator